MVSLFFHYNIDSVSFIQAFSGRFAKQIVLQVRAINYAANLQDFTVCIICNLETLGTCSEQLKDISASVYVGAILYEDNSTGTLPMCKHTSTPSHMIIIHLPLIFTL